MYKVHNPPETIEQRIERLERQGAIQPECPTCQREAYPALYAGKHLPFVPRHTASQRCKSGQRPHCTCDTCF